MTTYDAETLFLPEDTTVAVELLRLAERANGEPFDAKWAERMVEEIESANIYEAPKFSETRWPYTYAYDYMKVHDIFGARAYCSRAWCSGILRENPDKERIVRIFALAYCRENDIRIPKDFETGV